MKNILRSLKWSGLLVSAGLCVQLLCLLRIHPFSFIAFLGVGCPLVGAGVAIYLFRLLSPPETEA